MCKALAPDGMPRRIHGKISLPGKVTAIVGMCRAGKTTFVHQLRRERMARGQLLRDYVDVAMLRDVVERHAVTNIAGLRWFVRHLLGGVTK